MALTRLTLLFTRLDGGKIYTLTRFIEHLHTVVGQEEFFRRFITENIIQGDVRLRAFFPRTSPEFSTLLTAWNAGNFQNLHTHILSTQPSYWYAPTAPQARPDSLWQPHDRVWVSTSPTPLSSGEVTISAAGNDVAVLSDEGLAWGWIKLGSLNPNTIADTLVSRGRTQGIDWLNKTLERLSGHDTRLYRSEHPSESFILAALSYTHISPHENSEVWAFASDNTREKYPLTFSSLSNTTQTETVTARDIGAHTRPSNTWTIDPLFNGYDDNGAYQAAPIVSGTDFDADCMEATVSDYEKSVMSFLDSTLPPLELKATKK